MPRKGGTSVELTEKAKECLKKLQVRDTIKNIVSAGIIVFSKLSAEKREQAIAEANGLGLEHLNETEAEFRRRVLEIVQDSQALQQTSKAGRRTSARKPG